MTANMIASVVDTVIDDCVAAGQAYLSMEVATAALERHGDECYSRTLRAWLPVRRRIVTAAHTAQTPDQARGCWIAIDDGLAALNAQHRDRAWSVAACLAASVLHPYYNVGAVQAMLITTELMGLGLTMLPLRRRVTGVRKLPQPPRMVLALANRLPSPLPTKLPTHWFENVADIVWPRKWQVVTDRDSRRQRDRWLVCAQMAAGMPAALAALAEVRQVPPVEPS